MKGFLIKDLLGLKKYARTLVILMVFFLIWSAVLGSPQYFSGIMVMLFIMVPIVTFSYDDMAKWDAYGVALPVSRREIVLAKYMLALLVVASGTLISYGFHFVFAAIKPITGQESQYLVIPAMAAIGVCILSLIFPFIFRYGAEKARFIIIAVILVFLLAAYGAAQLLSYYQINVESVVEELMSRLWLLPVAAVGALLLSYLISCRIFENKEI
jgi:ABC-2 type transport system permease protein